MRLRLIAFGCALTGALGSLALSPGAARAENTLPAENTVLAKNTGIAKDTGIASTTLAGKRVPASKVPYAGKKGHTRKSVPDGKAMHARKRVSAGKAALARKEAQAAAHARVVDRIAGYRRTWRSSGITWDLFHWGNTLTLYVTVLPKKHGDCLEPETEQYEKGRGWTADTKYGCDRLDAASHDTAPFSLSQAVGARYRIRGDYFRDAGNSVSVNGRGPWLYFSVSA